MNDTIDHIERAHKHNEETLGELYAGLEHFEGGGDADELREGDPDLVEALEDIGVDLDAAAPDNELSEHVTEYALHIDVEQVVTIWLTMGGPNIYLEARTRDGELVGLKHVAAWGTEDRVRHVGEGSALWRYAESCVELAQID